MQHKVGRAQLLDRGLEGFAELQRQVLHEAHAVEDIALGTRRQRHAPRRDVQRHEDAVAHKEVRASEAVDNGALANIGVSDQTDGLQLAPALALHTAVALQAGQLLSRAALLLLYGPLLLLPRGLRRGAEGRGHAPRCAAPRQQGRLVATLDAPCQRVRHALQLQRQALHRRRPQLGLDLLRLRQLHTQLCQGRGGPPCKDREHRARPVEDCHAACVFSSHHGLSVLLLGSPATPPGPRRAPSGARGQVHGRL
mmetsp:Transcript_134878/g.375890  ORF Transcript_134878/g.375890 Transcript_134878/m.375890 type:complete len:253 (-) Transcript_134878:241-999(-)